MPERLSNVSGANFVTGTTLESGAPNTGQCNFSFGASRTFSKFSGVVGPDNNLWVGGGRLMWGAAIPSADAIQSGIPVLFYDSAIAASGGPFSASGHKVIGVLRGGGGGEQIVSGELNNYGTRRDFETVFTSGLCATTASGQFGYFACFTPVTSG